jgi:hypothetical protein
MSERHGGNEGFKKLEVVLTTPGTASGSILIATGNHRMLLLLGSFCRSMLYAAVCCMHSSSARHLLRLRRQSGYSHCHRIGSDNATMVLSQALSSMNVQYLCVLIKHQALFP